MQNQDIQFSIKPFEIVQVATKLKIRITGSTATTCSIYYVLVREDGREIETGVKTFPIQSLAILAQDPINKAALNMLLSAWDLEAL